MKLPIPNYQPNMEEFLEGLMGKKEPGRVLLAEYALDEEIRKTITEEFLGEKWSIEKDKYWDNYIKIWQRLGYDYVRFEQGLNFQGRSQLTDDTAELSRGKRSWLDEGKGPIQNWEDFEKFNWPKVSEFDYSIYEYISRHLPEGMGMIVSHGGGIFEQVAESILGFEGLCELIYEEPELVEMVFEVAGGLIYEFYQNLLEIKNIRVVMQGDDLGFKTSTFLSPKLLREYVFPWHQKYAELAHAHGMPYFLHSCGNLGMIYEDLIETVKIDGKHSFEDEIMPVADFKKQYGKRIATIGGVDLNKLCILEENELRKYLREILNQCQPGGRYAFGSGNTIANYVPLRNYFILLEEAFHWKG